jgi:hypothetical protein
MVRLLSLVFLATSLLLARAPVASAAAPTQVAFTQTVSSDVFLSARQAGNNAFFVDVAQGEFVGLGNYTETDRFLLHADGTAVFSGIDICTCTVGGRSGTLTIRYTGKMAADGTFVSPFVIVSGRGDLASLRGTGVTAGTFTGLIPSFYTDVIQYHFAP